MSNPPREPAMIDVDLVPETEDAPTDPPARLNPWPRALWVGSVIGAVVGTIMLSVGISDAYSVDSVEGRTGSAMAIYLGGPLLTASLVGVAIACAISYLEWKRRNGQ